MQQVIQNILIPVEINTLYLSVAKQAAELAKQHGAEIHLLHIAEFHNCRRTYFPWFFSPRLFCKADKEKSEVLQTWKILLENEFDIKVTIFVDWNTWQKGVIEYAHFINADLIVLQDEVIKKKKLGIRKTTVENIIENSPCQVITIFSSKKTMAEWKQIVIPVTDYIPELRIQTIIDIAKLFHLKIHLITIPQRKYHKQAPDFYFLTETLKRLKPAANIQVECRCLQTGINPVNGFLNYAHSVGADSLLTNMRFSNNNILKSNPTFFWDSKI